MDLQRLGAFARTHHGLVTFGVAAQLGTSRRGWYRLIERGQLEPLHPRVARLVGQPSTREQRILAAILAIRQADARPTVVLASHRSAAHLLGLERPHGDPVDLIVTTGHARRLAGVVTHRPIDLDDLAPTTRAGIPCTNELRTLVDLGAVDPAAVPAALDRFAVTRRLTPATVATLIERHSRSGRTGVGVLRQAFATWPLADQVPDSELELAMARLLRAHGLPPATFHARVAGYEVDFLVEDSPIVIECDGWSFHVADRDQWEHDLERDAALTAAGCVVLRRSRGQIVREPDTTAARIDALLRRWAPHLLRS
jgi:very-short-patch-repair endonuclease